MNNNEKGIAHLILLAGIGVAALVIIASAGAYYFLKMSGGNKTTNYTVPAYTSPSPSSTDSGSMTYPTPTPSNSDKTTDIQTELDGTTVQPVDTDINQLNSSATGL